jgi:hypothetical protein
VLLSDSKSNERSLEMLRVSKGNNGRLTDPN